MKNKIKFISSLLILLLLFSSCIEEPEFRGVSNFKLGAVNKEILAFNVDVKFYNPNNYKLNIRKSTFSLYLNDLYVGEAVLLDKYNMAKKTTTLATVPVEIQLEKGVLLKLLGLSLGKTVELRISGKLKTTVRGFPVKQKIDETKSVNWKDLNINFNSLFQFN